MSETIANERAGLSPPTPPNAPRPTLPDEPLVVIRPSKSWVAINLRDLWAYRELLYFLAWRDIKVRYKQTALGLLWVVMQPLLLTLIFTVFLGRLARVPSDGIPYPLFIFVGLLPWTFFSNAVSNSGTSLVGNSHLITKVYFPRLIVPAAAVLARLMDFLVAFTILIGMLAFYGVAPTPNLLLLPVMALLTTAMALGFGLLIAALNVRYRDVGVVLPVLLQLWMFVSPILYPTSLVPESWRGLYVLNPVVGVIDGFRASILGHPFNWGALAITALATVFLLIYSTYTFRRYEKDFADVI